MNLEERIKAFVQLKSTIDNLTNAEKSNLYELCALANPWFTTENTDRALRGIAQFLSEESLTAWTNGYNLNVASSKKIGVAMAGNIPLVGFHDLLCVVIAGHTLVAKLSSQDTVLMNFMIEQIKRIDARFMDKIFLEERLKNIDALIATGSDNTSRYFEYYFRNIPHIIRKNRTSCAVIVGEEPSAEISKLGIDIFSYFGMGCRNVSKLFIPEGFNLSSLLTCWEIHKDMVNHHKYANNYDYQKCLLLMNQIPFYDAGHALLVENVNLVSPISVIYYEYYDSLEELKTTLELQKDKIQCIASAQGWYPNSIPFGQAQFPAVSEFADNIDTLKFLENI